MSILLPYQTRWATDKARWKIGMFSRQTGKTFGSTYEIVDDCVEADIAGARSNWVILSRGERQAKEAMNEGVRLHLKGYGLACELMEYDLKLEDTTHRAAEVLLPNGSIITALPANPDTARGFSRNVFLDEFAFHKDSRAIWGALFPVVSKPGLKLRITSTPNGKGNKFYELMTGTDPIWSRHRVDIYQAVKEGLDRNIDELRAAAGDEELWKQEFELEFLDEATSWLSYELIFGCEHPDAGRPELYTGGPVFIGNDIARRSDLWVAWVMELVGDVYWVREIVTKRRASFMEQDAELARLMSHYNVAKTGMDQTGMGEKPVEDAMRKYGAGLIHGFHLNGQVRLAVAQAAKQLFEDRRIRIPEGDPVLRADLHKIQKVISETGVPRLMADRDAAGHADRAWACFMACGVADPTLSGDNLGFYQFLTQQVSQAHADASTERQEAVDHADDWHRARLDELAARQAERDAASRNKHRFSSPEAMARLGRDLAQNMGKWE